MMVIGENWFYIFCGFKSMVIYVYVVIFEWKLKGFNGCKIYFELVIVVSYLDMYSLVKIICCVVNVVEVR